MFRSLSGEVLLTAHLEFQQPVYSIISWFYVSHFSNLVFVFLVDISVKAEVKLLSAFVGGKLTHPQLLLKNPLCSCQYGLERAKENRGTC